MAVGSSDKQVESVLSKRQQSCVTLSEKMVSEWACKVWPDSLTIGVYNMV